MNYFNTELNNGFPNQLHGQQLDFDANDTDYLDLFPGRMQKDHDLLFRPEDMTMGVVDYTPKKKNTDSHLFKNGNFFKLQCVGL